MEKLNAFLRDLLLGGLETSTTTLTWSLVLIANHPDVQACLQKEIDSVVLRERLPSLDDTRRLPYVEIAIFEVMRLKTLLPLGVPHNTSCDTEVGGWFVPKGAMVGRS